MQEHASPFKNMKWTDTILEPNTFGQDAFIRKLQNDSRCAAAFSPAGARVDVHRNSAAVCVIQRLPSLVL